MIWFVMLSVILFGGLSWLLWEIVRAPYMDSHGMDPRDGIDYSACHMLTVKPDPEAAAEPLQTFSRRPPVHTDPVIAKLKLTKDQRQLIVHRFNDCFMYGAGATADIKLEAFIDMICNSRVSEEIPVYFAQRQHIVGFAIWQHLPWLVDMIERPSKNVSRENSGNGSDVQGSNDLLSAVAGPADEGSQNAGIAAGLGSVPDSFTETVS